MDTNAALIEAIRVLEEERTLLLEWMRKTDAGSWSTHLIQPMKERAEFLKSKVNELKVKAYAL